MEVTGGGDGRVIGVSDRENNRPHLTQPDHFYVKKGEESTLFPLNNENDPDKDSIRIATVLLPENLDVTSYPGYISVKSDTPGTFKGTYQVIDFQGGTGCSDIAIVVE